MYTIYDEKENDYIKVEEPDHSLTYTYSDYMAWKFKERLELFRGKIFKMGAPNMNHQVVGGHLFNEFYKYLKGKTCRVFIAPFDDRGACGAPDLAIETLSPGNRKEELRMKYEAYEEAGVKEYWIADPAKKAVLVFRLQPDGKFAIPAIHTAGDRLEAQCVPGFTINVAEIFTP